MPGRATQDGRVMVESSDKTWSTGEGHGKPLQYSCLENPKTSVKKKKKTSSVLEMCIHTLFEMGPTAKQYAAVV